MGDFAAAFGRRKIPFFIPLSPERSDGERGQGGEGQKVLRTGTYGNYNRCYYSKAKFYNKVEPVVMTREMGRIPKSDL